MTPLDLLSPPFTVASAPQRGGAGGELRRAAFGWAALRTGSGARGGAGGGGKDESDEQVVEAADGRIRPQPPVPAHREGQRAPAGGGAVRRRAGGGSLAACGHIPLRDPGVRPLHSRARIPIRLSSSYMPSPPRRPPGGLQRTRWKLASPPERAVSPSSKDAHRSSTSCRYGMSIASAADIRSVGSYFRVRASSASPSPSRRGSSAARSFAYHRGNIGL